MADANGEASPAANGAGNRELLAGVDIVYLKNVLLKFLDAATAGRFDQARWNLAHILHALLSAVRGP